jgi:hypothetical protein
MRECDKAGFIAGFIFFIKSTEWTGKEIEQYGDVTVDYTPLFGCVLLSQ